ncbi:hypothetical protein BKA64DRAFT_643197 [Cadophora sp. MPI-SDFR-AT-0126]|nr:hypothetical protein BKA64DRAFT_643197 [Leotiomycetes sp. MPI-SDFR-AT-0126]
MKVSITTALVALVSLVQATITKPAAGDQWVVGEQTTIQWDTAGFSDKVDIALVPAGATDTSVVIAQIATQTANTGSQTWTPPSTMSAGDVSVIIVNSGQSSAVNSVSVAQTSSTSGVFVIVLSSGSDKSKGSHKNSTTTVNPSIITISSTATLTSQVTVQPNVTTPQTSVVTETKTTAPFAYSNSTTTTVAAGITASSTTRASVSGTGAGGSQPTFTGAASVLDTSRAQTFVSGGLAVVMGLLFL